MDKAKVLVIGDGIIGLAAAMALMKTARSRRARLPRFWRFLRCHCGHARGARLEIGRIIAQKAVAPRA